MKKQIYTTRIFDENYNSTASVVVNVGGARSGKCLEKGTEVVMFSGRLKRIENVKPGDKLMGVDSQPRTVLECHRGIGQMYKVHQTKGEDYTINENHILSLQRSDDAKRPQGGVTKAGTQRRPNGRYPSYGDTVSINIQDYIKQSIRWKRNFYGYRVGVDFTENVLSVEPYFMGLWLGDGYKHNTGITTADTEIEEYLQEYADKLKMHISYAHKKNNAADGLLITNGNRKGHGLSYNKLLDRLRKCGVINNKHIPDVYLYNNRENRLKLLAGLIDSDGYLHKNGYEIVQKDKYMSEQIRYLAASLGFRTSFNKKIARIKSIGYSCEVYRVFIYGNVQDIPTRIPRKQVPKNYKPHVNPYQSSIKVEPAGIGEYCGFSLDGDGLFLLKDFTVVHNSYSILQLLLMKFINEDNKQILITRKTLPALKRTAYRLFLNLSEEYGYYKYCTHNKTDYTLKIKNNNIDFLSVDNIEKIKSTEYNYVFLEEANEFSQLDYRIIHTRLSGQTTPDEPNRLILALNPSDLYGWINQSLIHESGVEVIHSSYLDNPFLSEEYIKILLDLKKSDPALYQIYCLGEWAEISNIVYNNYIIEPSFPETFDDEIYGLDYGYHNPSALMWVGFKDDELYVREMIYQTNLTNQDLINKMVSDDINKKIPMYADSSEPDRIEEAHRAGFNILPAKKGKNSVFDGIDTLKRYRIHIHEEDINYIKEHRSYKWKEDKNGNVLDEPVKFNDHAEDGVRMAVFSYAHRPPQIKSIPTSVGGGSLGRLRG